jgi:Protein of unknown function (DUF3551)
MRALAWIILAAGTMLVSAPAQSQTYDLSHPVCLQLWDIQGGYIECAYASLAQCNAAASGRAAQCLINPFFPPASLPPAHAERHGARVTR